MSTVRRRQSFHLRTYRRVPVHCEVYFSNDETVGTGTIWNLSRTGGRVDATVSVKRGAILTLFIVLPDSVQTVLVDRAEICWSRGHEFGLKVLSIKPEDDARLKHFVATTDLTSLV